MHKTKASKTDSSTYSNSSALNSHPQLAHRPFGSEIQKASVATKTPTDIENVAFAEQQMEATGFSIQAKYGTITSEGQERLTVLQAKMDGLLNSRLSHATRFGHNIANIPLRRPDTSTPIQPKLTIGQPGDKYEQEADETARQVVQRIHQSQGEKVQRESFLENEELQMKPERRIQRESFLEDEELQMNQSNQDIMGLTCQRSSSGRQEIEVISPSLSTAGTNVLQRVISLEDEDRSLSATEAFELIRGEVIQVAVPTNALLQVLTRFDFTNRSFTGKQELTSEVKKLLEQEYSFPHQTITMSSEREIIAAAPDDLVILGRGCNSIEQLNNILKNSSAGGAPNSSVAAPSEESAISDVAFEGVPWEVSGAEQAERRQVPRIEFTTDVGVLWSFADRGGAIYVKIQKKYLTKGSGSENGWISDVSAPVVVLSTSQ